MSRPLLLGHRGARACKSIPENTPASFDRALADGCDGFEFDVRFTSDGQAVVCHDPVFQDPKFGGFELARTAAQQLPTLPRLQDVLARYPGVFLDIELKVPGLQKIVIEVLKSREDRRFVVSSFLPEALQTLHAADATIPLGLICETQVQLLAWNQLLVQYVIPHRSLVDQDLIRRIHAAGNRILVWTVNLASEMKRFADWGVDGIISDDTELLGRLKPELG